MHRHRDPEVLTPSCNAQVDGIDSAKERCDISGMGYTDGLLTRPGHLNPIIGIQGTPGVKCGCRLEPKHCQVCGTRAQGLLVHRGIAIPIRLRPLRGQAASIAEAIHFVFIIASIFEFCPQVL